MYYISASNEVTAILERKNEVDSIYYVYKDHLGSFDFITKQDGSVKQHNNFDPWGRRRNPDAWYLYILMLFTLKLNQRARHN